VGNCPSRQKVCGCDDSCEDAVVVYNDIMMMMMIVIILLLKMIDIDMSYL
jgi:hypothetical protein